MVKFQLVHFLLNFATSIQVRTCSGLFQTNPHRGEGGRQGPREGSHARGRRLSGLFASIASALHTPPRPWYPPPKPRPRNASNLFNSHRDGPPRHRDPCNCRHFWPHVAAAAVVLTILATVMSRAPLLQFYKNLYKYALETILLFLISLQRYQTFRTPLETPSKNLLRPLRTC